MVKKTSYYITENTVPYKNLAMEEYLLENVEEDQCILYLWQNKHTVVIGKNQNAYKESNANLLEEDGGYLVRRLSGGGSVFHDLGNLNFTFLIRDKNYDIDRQLEVIRVAARKFGLDAVKSGRNDIVVDGRKFSGNAFLQRGDKRYHHGTILIDTNTEDMNKYLNVSQKKLNSKGISSVKSRVVNLVELNKDINIKSMEKALVEAFNEVYGIKAVEIKDKDLNWDKIEENRIKFASNDFKYGKNMVGDLEINERFDWGEVQISFKIRGDIIEDILVHSDSMEWDFTEKLEKALINSRFNKEDILNNLSKIKGDLKENIYNDIYELIVKEEI